MKDTLTKEDLKKWGQDTVIYCVLPTLLVFLNSLQTGNFQVAIGAAQVAFVASLINLLKKHSAGVDGSSLPKEVPNGTEV